MGCVYGVGHMQRTSHQPRRKPSGSLGPSSLAGVHGSPPGGGGTWHRMGLRGESGWRFQEKPRMSRGMEVREFGCSGYPAQGQALAARKRH